MGYKKIYRSQHIVLMQIFLITLYMLDYCFLSQA